MRDIDIRVFLTILQTGSFAETARVLYLTQPAVSAIVHLLEKELNSVLLKRGRGKRNFITPTVQGEIFADFCMKYLAEYNEMIIDITESKGESLEVAIVASPTIGASIIPLLLGEFRKECPQVNASCVTSELILSDIYRLMAKGEYNIGISPYAISNKNLVFDAFFCDPIIPIAPVSFGLKSTISMREFKTLPIIARPETSLNMQSVRRALASHKIDYAKLDISMEVAGDSDVLQAVEQGSGVGFITNSLYEANHTSSKVVPIKVQGFQINRYLYLVREKKRELPRAAKMFWDYAKSPAWRKEYPYNTFPRS